MNWKVFAVGSALFSGLTAVLAKVGVEDMPSNLATLLRTIVIIVFLTALVLVRGEWRNPAQLPSRSLIFLSLSALATGLAWLCYYRALQLGPASLVAPVDKLSLVIAVFLSVLFLGERLSAWQWAGGVLITLGALLMTLK